MAHAHSIKENPMQIAGIAAISATIGAITAILVTPRSGREARSGIKTRAIQGKEKIMDKIHSSKDQASDMIDDTQEQAEGIKDMAKDQAAEITAKSKSRSK